MDDDASDFEAVPRQPSSGGGAEPDDDGAFTPAYEVVEAMIQSAGKAATRPEDTPPRERRHESRLRRDSKQFRRPGVRVLKSRSPWTSPASRHFPRRDIWEWSKDTPGANDAVNFEQEFCKATQQQLAPGAAGPRADGVAAAASNESAREANRGGVPERGLRKAPSLRNSIHEQLVAAADVRRAFRDNGKGKSKLKTERNLEAERKPRRFSLVKNYRRKAAMEREAAAIKEREAEAHANGLLEGYPSRRDLHLERAPTPPLQALGLADEETGDAELDRAKLEAAPDLLIAKHETSLTSSTAQETFVKACHKSAILPEPILVPRQEPDQTLEASKMHQNLDIRTKADLLPLESREVVLWDWRIIAKGRTPDELRLEHYGMGDLYMPALAEALSTDAKHARQGKRAYRRLQLSGCRVSAKGVKSLAKSLRDHPRVQRIDFARNALGPWAADPLCALFTPASPASTTLTALDLSYNALGDLAIVGLFQALRTSVVQWVNLTKNEISARGAAEIVVFVQDQFQRKRQRQEADSNQHQGQDPLSPLADLGAALSSEGGRPTLLEKAGTHSFIDLASPVNESSFGRGGIFAAKDEAAHNQQILTSATSSSASLLPSHDCPLSTLILDWNRVQGPEATALLRAVAENTTLRELSLAWNGLGSHEACMEAATEMVRASPSLRKANLGHNRIAAGACEALLQALPFSASLLCLDISGNEDHEDIFADPACPGKAAESWAAQALGIEGRSFIYTRYDCAPSADQQALVATRNGNHNESLEEKTESAAALADGETSGPATVPASTASSSVCDANLWKRRGVCWLERRWTPQTIWYYPGISGPPSSEIFLEVHLPGGSAMVTRMTFAPELQSCADTVEGPRASRASVTSAKTVNRTMGAASSGSKKMPNRSRQATRMLAAQRTVMNNDGQAGLGNGGLLMKKAQLRARMSTCAESGMLAASPNASSLQPRPPAGGLGFASGSEAGLAAGSPKKSFIQGLGQRARLGSRASGSMATYDYRALKAQALARPSTLSNALLQSMQPGATVEAPIHGGSQEMLENVCDLSLERNEPICPAFATLMLPPGRVYYKFVARGKEIFARDADTCWTLWPLHRQGDAARLWTPEQAASALNAQEFPTIANFMDVSWPGQPVGGLSDPDPGSERPQPSPAWSIKQSIFRYHACDDVRKLSDAFNSDWEQVLENHYVVKAAGDEMPFIRELLWAHFANICTLFTLHACDGSNSFALSFDEIKDWIRSAGEDIVPATVTDELLYEIYDKSALIEARRATNQFGRHYTFMVKMSAERVKNDPGMLRYQLLQFLVLLATRVFSTVRLTSFVASHQDQEIARAQLRRVAPRRRSSVNPDASGAAPEHNNSKKPETWAMGQTSISRKPSAAQSRNSSRCSGSLRSDSVHPELGTPCFKSAFAAVHELLHRIFERPGQRYVHRDVFRRGHLFFQDVVNVFVRRLPDLRRIFDAHSVKGHVLHDFIPSNSWEDIFLKIHPEFSKVPLRRMFALSKSTFVDFEDPDFAPGLCFLEFLECLARLAHLDNLATAVLHAFEALRPSFAGKSLEDANLPPEDALAMRLELVIDQLVRSFSD